MQSLKAFISGITVPSVLIPFILSGLIYAGKSEISTNPLIHFIPLLWGIWNVFYFGFLKDIIPGELNLRLFITGALLGLIVAFLSVYVLNVPSLLGVPPDYKYFPFIVGPIFYGLVWVIFVKHLNNAVGLNENIREIGF
jgi:hypothetical protein